MTYVYHCHFPAEVVQIKGIERGKFIFGVLFVFEKFMQNNQKNGF